jgi:hypothetical protein
MEIDEKFLGVKFAEVTDGGSGGIKIFSNLTINNYLDQKG